MKFIKENKIIVLTLVIVLLSFGLLALPGQFAHYAANGKKTFFYNLNGYQWMFGTVKNTLDAKIGSASAHGIAALALLGVCALGLVFSKKSSFVSLLTSLALITAAVLFFTVSAAGAKAYPTFHNFGKGDYQYGWVPYLIGGLIVVAGLLMGYRTFKVMKDEIKAPAKAKGPTYSYLHK